MIVLFDFTSAGNRIEGKCMFFFAILVFSINSRSTKLYMFRYKRTLISCPARRHKRNLSGEIEPRTLYPEMVFWTPDDRLSLTIFGIRSESINNGWYVILPCYQNIFIPSSLGHLWICKGRTWLKITDKSVSLCQSALELAANYPITSNLWCVSSCFQKRTSLQRRK